MHKLLIILSTFFLACTTSNLPTPIKRTVYQVKSCETNSYLWTDAYLFVNRAGDGQRVYVNQNSFVFTGKRSLEATKPIYKVKVSRDFGCPEPVVIEPVDPVDPDPVTPETFQPLVFAFINGKYVYRKFGSKIIEGTPISFGYIRGEKRSGPVMAVISGSTEFTNVPEIVDPENLTAAEIAKISRAGAINASKFHHSIIFRPTFGEPKEYKLTPINILR